MSVCVCAHALRNRGRERERGGQSKSVCPPHPGEPSWVLVKATLVSRSFTFSTGCNKAVGRVEAPGARVDLRPR